MAKPGIGIEIEGFPQLSKELDRVSNQMFRKYARAGVSAVAREKAKEQKSGAPRTTKRSKERVTQIRFTKSGRVKRRTMRDSIKVKPSSRWRSAGEMARRGVVGASVGPRWPDGAQAHLIEFGFLQTHVMLPNGVVVKRKVPKRIAPNPFVRRAFDKMKARQNGIFADKISAAMEKDMAKNGNTRFKAK